MLGPSVPPAAVLALLEELAILEDALIGGTVGALIGATLTYRMQRRRTELDSTWITVRWTWLGVAAALLAHLVSGVT